MEESGEVIIRCGASKMNVSCNISSLLSQCCGGVKLRRSGVTQTLQQIGMSLQRQNFRVIEAIKGTSTVKFGSHGHAMCLISLRARTILLFIQLL